MKILGDYLPINWLICAVGGFGVFPTIFTSNGLKILKPLSSEAFEELY